MGQIGLYKQCRPRSDAVERKFFTVCHPYSDILYTSSGSVMSFCTSMVSKYGVLILRVNTVGLLFPVDSRYLEFQGTL